MQPTIVVAHAGSGQNVGLVRALRGTGYDGPILMGSHGLNEAPLINALQGVGALGKLQIVSRFASPDVEGKELDEIRAAAQKYGKKTPVATTTVMGWALGKVMEAALRKCGYPCPGEKLNGVLEGLTVEMGALMGGPVQFSPRITTARPGGGCTSTTKPTRSSCRRPPGSKPLPRRRCASSNPRVSSRATERSEGDPGPMNPGVGD